MQPKNTFAGFLGIATLLGVIQTPITAQEAEPDSITVVSLQYANAAEMLAIVDQIFGDEIMKAADKRTNAMVLRGPKQTVEMVQMVLDKLDRVIEPPPVKTQLRKAQLRKVRNLNDDPATLSPSKDTFQVRSPRQGTIVSLSVRDRQGVKKGDVLAVLQVKPDADREQQELRTEMAKAEAKERAQLLDIRQRELEAEMIEAEHRLSMAHQQQAQNEAELRLQKLALETKLADAQSKFKVLSTRATIAEQRSNSGTGSAEEALVIKAESESAKRAIELLKQQLELHLDGRKLELAKIEHEAVMAQMTAKGIRGERERLAKRAKANNAARSARAQLVKDRQRRGPAETRIAILAPRDGVVRHLRVEQGSNVSSRQPILQIANE